MKGLLDVIKDMGLENNSIPMAQYMKANLSSGKNMETGSFSGLIKVIIRESFLKGVFMEEGSMFMRMESLMMGIGSTIKCTEVELMCGRMEGSM